MTTQTTEKDRTKQATRTIERCMEINAPIERVWKALTEAEELARWFPLQAKVEPGKSGSMFMSWDDWFQGTATIEVWEPPTHLRTTFFENPGEAAQPMRTHVDYYLEGKGGSTILRLVHSGIGATADWDELYHGVRRGWRGELCSLRHYLQGHYGQARRVAWALVPTQLSRLEVWERLTGPNGLRIRGDMVPGDRYFAFSPNGDEISGTVLIADPEGAQLCATVETLGDAYLRFELDNCSGSGPQVWFWLATWGLQPGFVKDLEKRWAAWLERLFAE